MGQDRTHRHRDDDGDEEPTPQSSAQQRREKIDNDVEATLDEIDDVLEDNAEDFVRAYVQKGGE